MEKKLEIKKLADVVVWADNLITAGGYYEEKYNSDSATAYCHVKAHELWKIKEVVLESINRHNTYTNALNKDIADKAAKIDLLEKELEGRKEGYTALKKRMDTEYISIDEHDMINKSLEENVEIYEKEIERLNRYNTNLEKANNNLVTRVSLLEPEIESRKNAFNDLREEMASRYIAIETHNGICKSYEDSVAELEKELADCKVKIRHQKENLDGINKTLEIRTKENESLIAVKNNKDREIEAHESENARLSEKIVELKKERDKHIARVNDLRMELDCVKASKEKHEEAARDKTVEDLRESFKYWRTKCLATQEELEKTYAEKEADLKNHNRRDMNLVDELAGKNDKIKSLVEEIEYYKGQERIRTDQLRATESKVEELWRLVNELKKEKKEGDDYAKSGFKLYVKNTLAEAEGDKNEANEIITEAVRSAYTEWGKRQAVRSAYTKRDKTQNEEEEAEVKGVGRTSSGRYPWGAKVNDIPCGSDSIE